MIGLQTHSGKLQRLLCIGAHCDDIEIGCGGTLLQMQRGSTRLAIDWIVLTGGEERRVESTKAMRRLVKPANRGNLLFGGFPDARLPARYGELKDWFDGARRRVRPDIVFTHERIDAHQDHRVINEMTWGAFRDHLILEYEIVKWDGGFGNPNTYVPLSKAVAKRKVDTLLAIYGSQRGKDWFTADTFMSVMRIRGVECRSPSGYAEAFTTRKLHLHVG